MAFVASMPCAPRRTTSPSAVALKALRVIRTPPAKCVRVSTEPLTICYPFQEHRYVLQTPPLMLNVSFSGALEVLVLWCTFYACSSYCVHIMVFIYVSIYLFYYYLNYYYLVLSLLCLYICLYASALPACYFHDHDSRGARSTHRSMLSIAMWCECHLSRAQRSRLLFLHPKLFR